MSNNLPVSTQLHMANTEGKFIFIHPETNFDLVVDSHTGKTLREVLETIVGVYKPTIKRISLKATIDKQTKFTFTDSDFDVTNDTSMVFMNGEFLHPGEEYNISKTDDLVTIDLVSGININDKIFINDYRIKITSVL